MRRGLVALTISVVTCLLLAGVAFPESEIRVLMLTSPAMLALRDMVPKFEAKYPDVKVVWEDTAYADIHTKQVNDFVSHAGRYDVLQMDNPWLPEYAGAGFLENLEPWIEKADLRLWKDNLRRWPPGVEKYPTIHLEDLIVPILNFYGNWEGNLYCIPNMPGVQLLYYRKDLFENEEEKAAFRAKYGYDLEVPKTWEQLRDVAEFFTRPPELYGLTWSAGKGNMAVQNYYNIAWSWGADCFAFGQGFPDPEDPIRNMPICNSEIGVKALEFFCSLKPFMPPGAAAYEWAEITADFTEGKAAMMFQWSDFVRDVEDPAKSKVAGKVGYALMPGKPDAPVNNVPGIIPGEGYASLGGWGLVMNKDSKNKEAAWKFIAWASCLAMTHDEMKEYLEVGGTNTGRLSGYFIPETTGYRVGRYPIELEMYREHIRRRPAIAEEVEYEVIVGTEVQQAFIGAKTPKQALDDAAKALYELMVRGGYIPEDQPLVWPSKYVNPDGTKVTE
jgi:multiple sugar transport system substrate-binding protein